MKHVKMVLYGEPGVGKSVFASKAPKPFFITTDGNYEFLSDFGAKEEDHVQVNSWAEAKRVFNMKFEDYDTIVVDLTEDLFKWCEYEYCKVNGYEHVSDVGFGKGYDITRNDFFINICKILNLEKNVILIMHGIVSTVKDRRGIEHTKYYPSNRIPDKVLDMIEGRVRYFLRAYSKAEEVNGKLVLKRYLSLVPKENEYGILRGIDENSVPSDIPLDFNVFANTIGLDSSTKIELPKSEVKVAEAKPEAITILAEKPVKTKVEVKPEAKVESEAKKSKVEAETKVEEPVKTEVKAEEKPTEPQMTETEKKAKMLADIKAKMLAMQNKNK